MENPVDERDQIVQAAIGAASDCLQFIPMSIAFYRGSQHSFYEALEKAETAYLETYVAWAVASDNKEAYKDAHQKAGQIREKMLAVKKLLDELECETERALQSVHSLRT